MKLKTFNGEYGLLEFNYHIDNSYRTTINILELLIETNEIDYVKEELNDSFIIEAEHYTYVFSDFKVEESYLVGDELLLIVCVK